MSESPPGSADESLFRKHVAAGKEAYEAGRLEDAARDLEEAYLLRPRDPKILNLLGLLYFKQERFEKAEEVYRKLAAHSPEAHTLHFNLGLIYLKLSRLDDAESAFLKSLELAPDNPKISFYLGSIYEKQRRFQDAIFQYRHAGANVLVRRVEDRLQPGRPPKDIGKGPPRREPAAELSTDTEPVLVPAKDVRPVGDEVLLADAAQRGSEETRPHPSVLPVPLTRATPNPKTLPPLDVSGSPAPADIVSFFATLPAHPPPDRTGITGITSGGTGIFSAASAPIRQPPTPAPRPVESFRLLQANLLEIAFSGKIYVKQGTVYSYTGNLAFWVKEKRAGATPALVIVTGSGRVLLMDRDREISVNGAEGPLCVRPSALVACEEALNPSYLRLGEAEGAPEFLQLEGRGAYAVSIGSRPLTLAVTPDQPVAVAAASVILWSGSLQPRLVQDEALAEALLAPGGPAQTLVRLEGTGRVMMEQAF